MTAFINFLRVHVAPPVLAVALVWSIGYGFFLFVGGLVDKLNSISGDLAKAIVAGGIALVTSVVTLTVGKVWEQKVKVAEEIRQKKSSVYEEQINLFFSTIFASKFGEPQPTEQELGKAFLSFTQKLVVWGGPDVIKAWSDFRLHNWGTTSESDALARLEAFIKAIRVELGNDSRSLQNGQLLKLFINDVPLEKPEPAAPKRSATARPK